jgi:hypothetical protein
MTTPGGQDGRQVECALLLIATQCGRLLAPRQPGRRTDLEEQPPPRVAEVSEGTTQRWRSLADHEKDVVRPLIQSAPTFPQVASGHLGPRSAVRDLSGHYRARHLSHSSLGGSFDGCCRTVPRRAYLSPREFRPPRGVDFPSPLEARSAIASE